MNRLIGCYIILASFFWTLVETAHYGWNLTAKSDAEMLCDGIGIIIFSIGLFALKNDKKEK